MNTAGVVISEMAGLILRNGLSAYENELLKEAKERENDPDFHVSATAATLTEIEEIRRRLSGLEFTPDSLFVCLTPGCSGTFHPEMVREPGPNGEHGYTGWRFDRTEDDNVPIHEHLAVIRIASR